MSRRSNRRASRQEPPFRRETFDVVVDIPQTEGLEAICEQLEDLDIVCAIDQEDIFSHTYEERDKKMRVSLMPEDQHLVFKFVNSADETQISEVALPVEELRTVSPDHPLKDSMFWMNMKIGGDHVFGGQLGRDDLATRDPRMLLKYSILDEGAEPEEDEPEEEIIEDLTQVKEELK